VKESTEETMGNMRNDRSAALWRNPHLWYVIIVMLACSIFYYLESIIAFIGWPYPQWAIFDMPHDLHRFLFLIPVLYAAYTFRVRGAIAVALISILIFLPRALFISPYPDALLRPIIFSIVAGALGILMSVLLNNSTERKEVEVKLKEKTIELEKANIHLQEVDRLKSVFLASMSHELRTPLNSIIGFTSLILKGMAGGINDEQKKQLTMVKNSSNHLLSLINDVLDISKIEAGKVEFSLEEFRLGDVVREVVDTFSTTAGLKNIELVSDVPEDTTLFSDRRCLKQILMNLVSNAVKFTEQGSLTITARVLEDENLEICVADTGIGIKEEDMYRLFMPFQQVDMSLTKKHEGTGLGLYHSKKLAGFLGGDISVKSEYGRGSEFTFTTPLQYEEGKRNESR